MRVLGDERLGGRVNSFARGVYMDFTISVVLVEGKKTGTKEYILTRECLLHRLVGFARFSNTTYTHYTVVFYCHHTHIHVGFCIVLYRNVSATSISFRSYMV